MRSIILFVIISANCFCLEALPGGVNEANKQFENGYVTIYSFGDRDFWNSYDKENFLPIQAIAGCVVDQEILNRASTHNEHVANEIKAGKIPRNSLKVYDALIRDPKKIPAEWPGKRYSIGEGVSLGKIKYNFIKNKTGYFLISSNGSVNESIYFGDEIIGDVYVYVPEKDDLIGILTYETPSINQSFRNFVAVDGLGGVTLSHIREVVEIK